MTDGVLDIVRLDRFNNLITSVLSSDKYQTFILNLPLTVLNDGYGHMIVCDDHSDVFQNLLIFTPDHLG